MGDGSWSASAAMGTTVHICLISPTETGLAAAGHEAVAEVDAALSRFLPDSDASRLNASPQRWIPVGPHLAPVAEAARRYRLLTGGVFDACATARPLPEPRVHLRLGPEGGPQAWLAPGCRLDFGAIAKGYAADLARERCAAGAAGVLVSVGTSSISMAGSPPHRDTWRVAIGSPWQELSETLGYLELDGGSLSTSGIRGARLGSASNYLRHVLDPRTGEPARTDLCSVGILSEDGMRSEALSTACLVLGLEAGLELCRQQQAAAVFLTAPGEVIATPNLADRLSLRRGVRERLRAARQASR